MIAWSSNRSIDAGDKMIASAKLAEPSADGHCWEKERADATSPSERCSQAKHTSQDLLRRWKKFTYHYGTRRTASIPGGQIDEVQAGRFGRGVSTSGNLVEIISPGKTLSIPLLWA
jgi:hypothetical protein